MFKIQCQKSIIYALFTRSNIKMFLRIQRIVKRMFWIKHQSYAVFDLSLPRGHKLFSFLVRGSRGACWWQGGPAEVKQLRVPAKNQPLSAKRWPCPLEHQGTQTWKQTLDPWVFHNVTSFTNFLSPSAVFLLLISLLKTRSNAATAASFRNSFYVVCRPTNFPLQGIGIQK